MCDVRLHALGREGDAVTVAQARAVADAAIAAHDADFLEVAADAFEETGDVLTALVLRWRAIAVHQGFPNSEWSWT